MTQAVTLRSEAETLSASVYGSLPARRAVVLVHGQNWDASGWQRYAPLFVERGVPALAVDLRGKGSSTGNTDDYVPGRPWSPALDVRAAKEHLRANGVREIALVGTSLGGHAVLASSFDGDVECVVSVSAPVVAVPDELSRQVTGRKLFICAQNDSSGAFPHVLKSFAVVSEPKQLVVFGGDHHSRHLFKAEFGAEVLRHIVDFVARGL